MELRFVDEHDGILGWIDAGKMRRTSHALAADGRVWLGTGATPRSSRAATASRST